MTTERLVILLIAGPSVVVLLIALALMLIQRARRWRTNDLPQRMVCLGCQHQLADGRNPPVFVDACRHCHQPQRLAA